MENCNTCHLPFVKTSKRKLFCSSSCSSKSSIRIAQELSSLARRNGETLVCSVCSKEYYVPKYRLKSSRYCSRSCLAKFELPKHVKKHGFLPTGKPYHKYQTIYVGGKQVRKHRWIMELHIGRKLEKWEHVHHINGNPSDNRIENLIVLSNADHQRVELKLRKNSTSS